MLNDYLDNPTFVDYVLEKGCIPFVVRGNVKCIENFNFAPLICVQISNTNYRIRVFGENKKEKMNDIIIKVREIVDDVVFSGEIKLPERTIEGISKAINSLELWADFLCITIGNPKIFVEVQKPRDLIISSQSTLDYKSLQRLVNLLRQHLQLGIEERSKLESVLWWYRKASSAAYYSLFDSYTAYWNCLEILCSVSGSKLHQGVDIDNKIEVYLKGKIKITSGHILHCYNNFVNYSIKEQIKDALITILKNDIALEVIYQCFEIKPEGERLYQIRNDINHGNIRENSEKDYLYVYYRGELLRHIVFILINNKLGQNISNGMSVNKFAEKLQEYKMYK
jgi:hypothetical protein